eukprot:Gb_19541 [translate_table: standard]
MRLRPIVIISFVVLRTGSGLCGQQFACKLLGAKPIEKLPENPMEKLPLKKGRSPFSQFVLEDLSDAARFLSIGCMHLFIAFYRRLIWLRNEVFALDLHKKFPLYIFCSSCLCSGFRCPRLNEIWRELEVVGSNSRAGILEFAHVGGQVLLATSQSKSTKICSICQLLVSAASCASAIIPLPNSQSKCGSVKANSVREFNIKEDVYAHDSVELLKRSGIDFKKNEEKGLVHIASASFSCRLACGESYFFNLLRLYFPAVYDIKYLIKFCNNLHAGLNKLAEIMDVERIGPSHQAGSDSLLTSCIFWKLQDGFFDGSTDKNAGVLYGLGVDRP